MFWRRIITIINYMQWSFIFLGQGNGQALEAVGITLVVVHVILFGTIGILVTLYICSRKVSTMSRLPFVPAGDPGVTRKASV